MLSDKQIQSLIRLQSDQNVESFQESTQYTTLDLSHQQLRKLKEIQAGQLNVNRINASYNYFKNFSDLNIKQINQKLKVPFEYLDLSFNYFDRLDSSAESSHVLQYLKFLNVSANRIESLDFSNLRIENLETLILNNNKLQYFINCPDSLKILSINDNSLSILAFSGGQKLNAVSAFNNKIKKIEFQLPQLLVLDLQNNMIQDLEMMQRSISKSQQLLSINIRENPVCKFKKYRIAILQSCNNISQIDQIIISPHIRQGFKMIKSQQKLNQLLDGISLKYQAKLMQKQKIKQQLIKKIRQKQKAIQNQFEVDIQQEKYQLQGLQKQARQILAKKKYGVNQQTKKQFQSIVKTISGLADSNAQKESQDMIRRKHFEEYVEFLKKQAQKQSRNKSKQVDKPLSQKMSESILSIQTVSQSQNFKTYDPRCVDILFDHYDFDY